ncbi:hypothetical protein OAF27_01105 [Verrucomicrobiales bacterium]|nr:hypothetical protein [Verrucomicrobiales bacterium]
MSSVAQLIIRNVDDDLVARERGGHATIETIISYPGIGKALKRS